MHERKARMAELADGFVVLPGGFGTLDETLEMLTWNQLGLIAKPVVFLDVDGFFSALFEFFDRAVDDRFIRAPTACSPSGRRTVDEAVAIGIAPVPETRTSGSTAMPSDLDRRGRGPVRPAGRRGR